MITGPEKESTPKLTFLKERMQSLQSEQRELLSIIDKKLNNISMMDKPPSTDAGDNGKGGVNPDILYEIKSITDNFQSNNIWLSQLLNHLNTII